MDKSDLAIIAEQAVEVLTIPVEDRLFQQLAVNGKYNCGRTIVNTVKCQNKPHSGTLTQTVPIKRLKGKKCQTRYPLTPPN